MFDVGRSMFDVHFFQSLLGKNNLALMVSGVISAYGDKAPTPAGQGGAFFAGKQVDNFLTKV